MSTKHGVSAKPFFAQDRYAELALGTLYEPGGSLADVEITVGGRGLSHTVIPDIDEDFLTVVGDQKEQVAAVADVLLSRWSRRELWNQPGLPMELQAYVAQLVERGEIFIHLLFERSPKTGEYSLFKTRWLPTETIVVRGGPPITYEQFISWRAYSGGSATPSSAIRSITSTCSLKMRCFTFAGRFRNLAGGRPRKPPYASGGAWSAPLTARS